MRLVVGVTKGGRISDLEHQVYFGSKSSMCASLLVFVVVFMYQSSQPGLLLLFVTIFCRSMLSRKREVAFVYLSLS